MKPEPDKLNYRDMNLRDHFAARAMQGMLRAESAIMFNNMLDQYIQKLTKASFKIADAMIQQREIATLQSCNLSTVIDSLNFALTYISYIKDRDFELHKEAVGTPNTEDHIVEMLKGLNDLRS